MPFSRVSISLALTALFLMGTLFLLPVMAEEPESEYVVNVDDDVELVTGTVGDPESPYYEEHRNWTEQGDFVGIRFSKDAWFVIVYGNEANPNSIGMMSVYLRYIGGADVYVEEWDATIHEIGIPVLSVFMQKLELMIEFEDVGYTTNNMFFEDSEPIGAENNLFDLRRTGEGVEDFDVTHCEPVHKAVSLQTSWERSEIVELEKEDFTIEENEREWEFSLTAEDLVYSKDWHNEAADDDYVDKVQFTFHIGVKAEQMDFEVPWYDVTMSGENVEEWDIKDSEYVGTKEYEDVTGLTGSFKYDHLIEGWDYHSENLTNTKLMLEHFSFFGTFVPDLVNQWFSKEYVEEDLGVNQTAVFSTPAGQQEFTVESELPEATLVNKELIEFKDEWREVGELTWISDVEVDGENEDVYCQVHAKQDHKGTRSDKDDGNFSGLLLMAGYIYPAGERIYHDPTYTSQYLKFDFNDPTFSVDLNAMNPAFLVCQVLLGIGAVSAAGMIFVGRKIRNGSKK